MILSINLYFSILFCFYCFTYEPTAIVNNECYNIQVKYWWLKCDPYHVSNKHKIIYNINSAIPMIFSSYIFKCFSSKLLIIIFPPKAIPMITACYYFPQSFGILSIVSRNISTSYKWTSEIRNVDCIWTCKTKLYI